MTSYDPLLLFKRIVQRSEPTGIRNQMRSRTRDFDSLQRENGYAA